MKIKKILTIIMFLMFATLVYPQTNVEVISENVRINVIVDSKTPFVLENINQKMSTENLIAFLTYFFNSRPINTVTKAPDPIDIILKNEIKLKELDKEKFYSGINELSKKYVIKIITTPPQKSDITKMEFEMINSWIEYNKK
ncbi:hypothetical protein KAJ27_23330 [bacterium]|nr:hypothetical protein [bacterium]